MKTNLFFLIIIFLAFKCHYNNAQTLDPNEELLITLSDQSTIKVYKKAQKIEECSNEYYSLPSHLKFSLNHDQCQEFSFITYHDEKGNQSSILHFLISWGLSQSQTNETQKSLVKKVGENAQFMGPIVPEIDQNHPEVKISGDSNLVHILRNSGTIIGRTTTFPNVKSASSFKLNKNDSKSFEEVLKNNKNELKKLFLSMNFIIQFKGKKGKEITKEPYQIQENLYTLLN
ncbi:hypothetical protein BTO06_02090 [Tenacibaculum sp. SZ-18]|uniref:hypothetical protein n=1 Tax=Tenacibaculum sp. SZ-18 TaxID=754423 RepID=UPI000C2CEC76|nr:hypothetical protein [Tenacibaculum sp. SZ-18]AUC14019.1 hypothetical protein BTO06_02090 [Tenacibaculum sp. SZ-18]